ncbi:MAG: dephospho-CoA kinase [Eubacterium sp.]|nr:dephospho-CoA kinase [Eubacterium sp.]
MKVIGITGGIGAGKSTVLNYLKEKYNALIFVTDEIAHDVMEPGGRCYEDLKKILPEKAFLSDGSLDRNTLASLMYADRELTQKINNLVHPAVGGYLEENLEKERQKKERRYVIIESALYDGTGFALLCDEVWNIDVTEDNRKARLMESRGYSEEKVLSIFKSQARYDEMRKTLKVQIDNNGEPQVTYKEVDEALAAL